MIPFLRELAVVNHQFVNDDKRTVSLGHGLGEEKEICEKSMRMINMCLKQSFMFFVNVWNRNVSVSNTTHSFHDMHLYR